MTMKSLAPIGIYHEFDGIPALGQPLVVQLRITAGIALRNVRLSVAAVDGVVIIAPLGGLDLGGLDASDSVTTSVEVLPFESRMGYLSVFVTGGSDGGETVRSMMIPIGIGASPHSAVGLENKAFEAIRSTPAVETVR
jgi:hypothetical protein